MNKVTQKQLNYSFSTILHFNINVSTFITASVGCSNYLYILNKCTSMIKITNFLEAWFSQSWSQIITQTPVRDNSNTIT